MRGRDHQVQRKGGLGRPQFAVSPHASVFLAKLFARVLWLGWWARLDSNQRQTGYEPVALTD